MKHTGKKVAAIFILFLACVYIVIPKEVPIKFEISGRKIDQVFRKNYFSNDLSFGLDIVGGSRLVFEADTKNTSGADKESALSALQNVMERRVNLFGVSEASVSRSKYGESERIVIELPGITNTNEAIALVGRTAKLEFALVDSESEKYVKTDLTGADLKNAKVSYDNVSAKPVVSLEFNEEGAKKFEKITSENVSKPLAIILDDTLVSAPIINERISGGLAQISGNFTKEDAQKIAVQLTAGSLPLPVSLIEEKTVGATLGSEAIQKSIKAGLVGLFGVIIFMILAYRLFGVVASFSLLVFALTSITIYKVVPIVLTLPGIAGFLLSVGMAVDSNILIFERYKEEKKKGLSTLVALETAFGRAWDSIRDANIATLTTAFILANPLDWNFLNSSGPVKGFAYTLSIGVLVGMFSGIFVSRNLLRFFIKK